MSKVDYIPQVREQYEEFPYPPRDPQDERERLVMTWLDNLAMINHYCFAGRQSFQDRFRVLVAGGGTGDATIFLAEQLRRTNAEIFQVDLSGASLDIARERARIRGLDNITWINKSLLALPELGLGRFDYVNCIGVLHHLADPDAGLRALLAVLKESGALALMVYGKYGRTGVYQMQSLMRLINQGVPAAKDRLANTREVLASIPETNWFKRGEDLIVDHKDCGDAGVYDVFLHACDRAYTVGELYEWISDRHGLHLQFTKGKQGRSAYMPEIVLGRQQPQFMNSVRALPLRQQQEIAELLVGDMISHPFYVTRSPASMAPYGDPEYVPFFYLDKTGRDLAVQIARNPGRPLLIKLPAASVAARVEPGKFGGHILKLIDGRRHFGEIFSLVRTAPEFSAAPPGDDELFRDFRSLFDFLAAIDRLLLRHRTVEAVAEAQ